MGERDPLSRGFFNRKTYIFSESNQIATRLYVELICTKR